MNQANISLYSGFFIAKQITSETFRGFFSTLCKQHNIMNQMQEKAYRQVLRGHNVIISGQGGTGKSYIVKEIYDALTSSGKHVFITCSTGIACTIYPNAQTLHSWAGILDGRYNHQKTLNLVLNDEKYLNTLQNIRQCDCLIIDELSMISKNIF